MVPFLYLVYAGTTVSVSAQTVVAHATSLGVAFVAAVSGTWRYARSGSVAWRAATAFALPGTLSGFFTARLLTGSADVEWLRGAFGAFLVAMSLDMARRARSNWEPEARELTPHSLVWLALIGAGAGAASAALGIGGGLIAVPALLYVGQLPVRSVAPTALAGVCLTTLAGAVGYMTSGAGPPVSASMVGFIDLRMVLPLAAGAVVTVPLGVRVNRHAPPPTLYWFFSVLFLAIGVGLLGAWLLGAGG
jgi:uncharacterized membrane protein YfcA